VFIIIAAGFLRGNRYLFRSVLPRSEFGGNVFRISLPVTSSKRTSRELSLQVFLKFDFCNSFRHTITILKIIIIQYVFPRDRETWDAPEAGGTSFKANQWICSQSSPWLDDNDDDNRGYRRWWTI
jgi:hypothetical protein